MWMFTTDHWGRYLVCILIKPPWKLSHCMYRFCVTHCRYRLLVSHCRSQLLVAHCRYQLLVFYCRYQLLVSHCRYQLLVSHCRYQLLVSYCMYDLHVTHFTCLFYVLYTYLNLCIIEKSPNSLTKGEFMNHTGKEP